MSKGLLMFMEGVLGVGNGQWAFLQEKEHWVCATT